MDWMKKLDDNRKICDLNAVPKSHNSGAVKPLNSLAYIPWLWAQCQNKSITQQLEVGIRAFDLRLRRKKNGKIIIPHCLESSYCVQKVIKEISNFLKKNPSEIVFLYFKRAWDTRKEWQPFHTRELWSKINEGPVIKQNINSNEPLKDIRGKIIPIPEYHLHSSLCKGKLDSCENILVNNSWSLKTLCGVTKNIKHFLKENNDYDKNKILEIQLNYVTLNGIIPPRIASFFTKKWFRIKSKRIKTWNDKPGFIGIDFADKETCKSIYEMNF